MENLEKVVRNGKVAVVHSELENWYTADEKYPQLIFSPKVVELVEAGMDHIIDEDWLFEEFGIKDTSISFPIDLCIEWVPEGTKFIISSSDYSTGEEVFTEEDLPFKA